MRDVNVTEKDKADFTDLVELACRLGAGDAAMVPAAAVPVEDSLARLCSDPPCGNYGTSAGCPPHVAGPPGFRKLLRECEWALIFRIEVPSSVLLSEERREVFRRLHEIAAEVERRAVQMGFHKSRGFAGGSCRELFCRDQEVCRVTAEGGPCRNPHHARPSISGFGVNVSKLMGAAGWAMNRVGGENQKDGNPGTGTVCGLVLVG